MNYFKAILLALTTIAGVLFIPSVEAVNQVGNDSSVDELAWRRGYHRHEFRQGHRYYRQHPQYRYYRQGPVIYRPYYYYHRPMYYHSPYYYGPYHPRSGVYIYFRT